MNKTRLTILPILGVFFALFFGWSTIKAQTVEILQEQFRQIQALPSGSVFQIVLTDKDATAASQETLNQFLDEVQDMLHQQFGIRLELSDPEVIFGENNFVISIKAGKGFMKVTASIMADVNYDDSGLHVNVRSIDVPIISVDPSTVNSYIQSPVNDMMKRVEERYIIRSLVFSEGALTVEAQKR